jgi:hypothetical protein
MHRQMWIEVAGPRQTGAAPMTEARVKCYRIANEPTARDLAREGDIRAGGRCVDHERIDFGLSVGISRRP